MNIKKGILFFIIILPLLASAEKPKKPVPKGKKKYKKHAVVRKKISKEEQGRRDSVEFAQIQAARESVDFLCDYGISDSVRNPKLYDAVKGWLRTRYRYGGHGEKGIDCSGFTKAVYREAYNIDLTGGGSASILDQDVVPVEKESLAEGDLVFFKIRKKRVSHVGVYLGSNKFAHAARHGGVVVSDLDNEYYKKRFFKAGRHKNFIYAEQQNTGTK